MIIANVSDAHRRLYDAWRCSGNTMEVFFLDVPKGSDRLRLRAFQLVLVSLLRDMEQAFGVKTSQEDLRKEVDIPFYILDLECIDKRNYSREQVRTRLDAFIEVLVGKKEMI